MSTAMSILNAMNGTMIAPLKPKKKFSNTAYRISPGLASLYSLINFFVLILYYFLKSNSRSAQGKLSTYDVTTSKSTAGPICVF